MSAEIPLRGDFRFEAKTDTAARLVFEPGNHDANNTGDLQKSGRLDIHRWNNQVKKRLWSYKPRILGIDSLDVHVAQIDPKKLDYSPEEKMRVWEWLPGNPLEINPTGKLIVVAGDIEFGNVIPQLVKNTDKEKAKAFTSALNTESESLKDDANSKKEWWLNQGAALAFLAICKVSLNSLDSSDSISRRRLLGLLTAGTFGAGAGLTFRSIGPLWEMATLYMDTEKGKEIFDKLAEITKPLFTQSDWINGRTALIAAKTQEAMDFREYTPPGSKAAVIMGNGHAYNGERLLESPDLRRKTIFNLAGEMVSAISRINKASNIFPKRDAINLLLDVMARGEIISVTDPVVKHSTDVSGVLNQSIRYMKSFQSGEVEKAVSSLRV